MRVDAALTGAERSAKDLGPLAWVLDELRKSLDGATKSLRRFVRDAELARGADLAALDASQLRIARQQLHQAVGALEMVGMAMPAKVLRAMEALAQSFVQRPEACSEEAASKMERASSALTEYLEAVLKGKEASPVALFPQYRELLLLVGDERVHPADLWPMEWRWIEVALPEQVPALVCDAALQARVDRSVLKVVKSGDVAAAIAMRSISLGFAAAQETLQGRVFWTLCAAYFEAVALGLCPPDVYCKRAASQILLQDRTLARGETAISERLLLDLLFFCAQAVPQSGADASVLTAVRSTYGLTQTQAVDYETPRFGRFDPVLLAQARKRIAAAAESWSALAGGDTNRLKLAGDQFALVGDSVVKLHPQSGDLARALTRTVEATVQSGAAPAPSLALEVATVVLYLEAIYEDLDATELNLTERGASLARRLDRVNAGGLPEPLEKWMEDLYRRVSDRQVMGSVVDELRKTLGQLEKSLDQFFRNPLDKVPLHEAPSQLAQMRGVFSVLGLDQAALAALRMRDTVEKFLVDDIDVESARSGIFLKLGNSLGAIGFLIDTLSYQRELAKNLFVYDEDSSEFTPLMGIEKRAPQTSAVPAIEPEAPAPMAASTSQPVPLAEAEEPDADEVELKDIFLQEAHEVVQAGLAAVHDLVANPSAWEQQTTLRRAFHTLKGSSRMVGFNEFGEAAWALEQLLNSWLAEQKPASHELLRLADEALRGLDRWVGAIGSDAAEPWRAQAFREAADALRLDNKRVELVLVGDVVPAPAAPEVEEPFDLDRPDFEDTFEATQSPVEEAAAVVEDLKPADLTPQEQVKVIGTLRIGIPLFNVFLNEADEWSRRLLTELTEWGLELHRPVLSSTVGLAHSLAGSSATVGYMALSDLARALEQALLHLRRHAQSSAEHVKLCIDAAEDIRRLLHQFAAGFLKDSDPALVSALKALAELEFPAASGVADSVYPQAWEESEIPAEEIVVAGSTLQAVPAAVGAEATPVLAAGEEDDIDVLDTIDVDLFPIFEEEALELLPQLGGALRQWTARPDNLGARNEVLRVLHTLKGSARLAGAMYLGELTHRMESAIEQLGMEDLQASRLESLLTRFDAIKAGFERLRSTPEQALGRPEVGPVAEAVMASAKPPLTPPVLARQSSSQTVRVRSQLLDRLVNQAGEVMITRSRMEARVGQLRGSLDELSGNLERLRNQLRDIELQAESQMQSRLALAKDSAHGFDPLEFDRFTRVQELTRMMAESVDDIATVQRNLQRTVAGTEDNLIAQARQTRELQRDLLRTRMVEFESIAERLYGVVRQASKDTNKMVKLDIQGGSLDIDRSVLERMAPAFEHLLRNAVAHGIEDAATRLAAGKPASGSITIRLHQQSNDVTVEFSDDGAGLDLDLLRSKAQAEGHVSSDAVLTDAELANLIFTAGFSTAPLVTELAGRGIGLDVVRSAINALGGRIETATRRGQGTRFTLVLPLTTAVTQVVMLRMGDLVIGVPANLVEMVRRVSAAELELAYQDGSYPFDHEKVPFFWAGALLQVSARSSETQAKTRSVAIFRSAGQRVALHVDEVLGNQEVVVKNLGPQLSRLPGLTSMSVLASGLVVLIYNPVALAAVYGEQARQFRRCAAQAENAASTSDDDRKATPLLGSGRTPLVLVVDDSITVRRVSQRLLKREGFRVALAADGLQALERLQEEKPAVVMLDIEMPRMDGFDLARNVRGDPKLRDLPIIMISSRIAEKHREHARTLGINHYLGKPYSEDELLGLLRQYCAPPLDAAEPG
ncbi:MAG: Hpt domain-containing protein [Rhodoferax sp.]|uniref:hybrid sensor histidine kinase/response regulator n=1 Tax=Rhodoferax sp. TaxID=50421 RepID=UPI0026047101|nr:Hpt domain-containing protein [Rhodoferax sp.]MDD5333011.1 Hpt domain-containing protein [Rhodoferax sp.]